MDYDFATYNADLDLLEVPSDVAPTPKAIAARRARMAKERGHDQAALTAAFDRLMAFATRLMELQLTQPADAPPPEPDKVEAKAKAEKVDPDLVQWNEALAGQAARHERRRAKYDKLKPVQASS